MDKSILFRDFFIHNQVSISMLSHSQDLLEGTIPKDSQSVCDISLIVEFNLPDLTGDLRRIMLACSRKLQFKSANQNSISIRWRMNKQGEENGFEGGMKGFLIPDGLFARVKKARSSFRLMDPEILLD